ncbi:MAG TPA: hypothetical protein VNS81_04910 [Nocardioides sp.]|nr:hypothetical protein [Nocardioides sp.]
MTGLDRRRTALLALASLLLLGALLATAVGQVWLHGQRADDDRAKEVRAAADHAVTAVLSYDYRRLQAGSEETAPLLTGDAADQFEEVQKPLRSTAPRLEAVVTAEVRASTVLASDESSARVLLFVDQVSSSKKLKQPHLDQSRVVVTLTHKDGHWLVATLSAV